MKKLGTYFYIFLFVVQTALLAEPWILKQEFLSPETASFDCHSSSIAETAPGIFCVVWKGGPGSGQCNIDMKQNVGIWSSQFDGSRWSDPVEMVSSHSVCWNPVLFQYPSKELVLFYRMGPDPRRTVSFMKRSQDGGKTWSEGEILPAGITGPTKNKPLLTEDGALICPASIAVGEPEDQFKATACWVDITEDQGRHWKKIGPLELPQRKFGVIEPALFRDAQGNLRMYCRDRAHKMGETGYIWEAVSEDNGLHWSELKATRFPNPDSGFDIADLGEGRLLLIYNHSHTDRFPLHYAVSLDGGNSWSAPYILDAVGEFPAAIVAADGLVHITYATTSFKQRRIKHAVVDFQNL